MNLIGYKVYLLISVLSPVLIIALLIFHIVHNSVFCFELKNKISFPLITAKYFLTIFEFSSSQYLNIVSEYSSLLILFLLLCICF